MPGHPKIQAESHSSNWPFQFCRGLKILQLLFIKRLNITKSIGNNFLPIFNFVRFIKRKIFECFREITYHKSKYLQEFHPCQNYRVSHKKWHLVLEGCSTPQFWARNKSWGCFGILRFSAFQNCPYFWLLAQLKLRYLRLKTPGVTFRMNTLCNCNTKILYLTMTPGVFNLKYLSFYWVKSQK